MDDKIVIRTVDEDRVRLKVLQIQWEEKMNTKDQAGGNSNDNQEMIEILSRLKTVK